MKIMPHLQRLNRLLVLYLGLTPEAIACRSVGASDRKIIYEWVSPFFSMLSGEKHLIPIVDYSVFVNKILLSAQNIKMVKTGASESA